MLAHLHASLIVCLCVGLEHLPLILRVSAIACFTNNSRRAIVLLHRLDIIQRTGEILPLGIISRYAGGDLYPVVDLSALELHSLVTRGE